MDIKSMFNSEEKPLDTLLSDGGFCGIFHRIGCIGDSLSSGEFESTDENGNTTYHDMFEYSWGQYMARATGSHVYNFSRGGMTAKEYCESFGTAMDYWNPDKACQAYIIALGDNDLYGLNMEIGTTEDIHPEDWRKNSENIAGYYGQIISRYKEIEPDAKFFLVTIPKQSRTEEEENRAEQFSVLLYGMAEKFEHTYVIDLRKYGPDYDLENIELLFVGGHLNPVGYMLSAKLIMSYMDWIIRHNMKDFSLTGFIGTPYMPKSAKKTQNDRP